MSADFYVSLARAAGPALPGRRAIDAAQSRRRPAVLVGRRRLRDPLCTFWGRVARMVWMVPMVSMVPMSGVNGRRGHGRRRQGRRLQVRRLHGRTARLVRDAVGSRPSQKVISICVGVVSVHHHVAVHFGGAREFTPAFTGGARDGAGRLVFATVRGGNGRRIIGTPPGVAPGSWEVGDMRRLQWDPETCAAMVRHQVVHAQAHL